MTRSPTSASIFPEECRDGQARVCARLVITTTFRPRSRPRTAGAIKNLFREHVRVARAERVQPTIVRQGVPQPRGRPFDGRALGLEDVVQLLPRSLVVFFASVH